MYEFVCIVWLSSVILTHAELFDLWLLRDVAPAVMCFLLTSGEISCSVIWLAAIDTITVYWQHLVPLPDKLHAVHPYICLCRLHGCLQKHLTFIKMTAMWKSMWWWLGGWYVTIFSSILKNYFMYFCFIFIFHLKMF